MVDIVGILGVKEGLVFFQPFWQTGMFLISVDIY